MCTSREVLLLYLAGLHWVRERPVDLQNHINQTQGTRAQPVGGNGVQTKGVQTTAKFGLTPQFSHRCSLEALHIAGQLLVWSGLWALANVYLIYDK